MKISKHTILTIVYGISLCGMIVCLSYAPSTIALICSFCLMCLAIWSGIKSIKLENKENRE